MLHTITMVGTSHDPKFVPVCREFNEIINLRAKLLFEGQMTRRDRADKLSVKVKGINKQTEYS
jgi:hypothetical protein